MLRGFTRGLRGFTRGLSWFHTRPFRGFTRAPNKGVNLVFNFLNTLASLRCGDNTSPPRGGGTEPPACASRHACLSHDTAANTDSATPRQRQTAGWMKRKQNIQQPNIRFWQEESKTAVAASLHAFGINIQDQECAKNARKRPAKAWFEVS